MFDSEWARCPRDTVSRTGGFDLSEASTDQLRELLVGVQHDVDRLQALHARAVAEFESRDGHRADGCASMAAWLRRKLRLSRSETRLRRRAAAALVQLPEVKAAVESGRIRPAMSTSSPPACIGSGPRSSGTIRACCFRSPKPAIRLSSGSRWIGCATRSTRTPRIAI